VPTKFTKADLLNGAEAVRDQFIKALGGEVKLRPLTDGEYSEVKVELAKSIEMDLDIKNKTARPRLDLGAFGRCEYQSNCIAAAYGLSCNKVTWTPEEVKNLKAGAVDEIASIVLAISGVTLDTKEMLESFRAKSGGPGDSGALADGDTTGEDAGGDDPGTEDSAS